jgi:hypothetical protein
MTVTERAPVSLDLNDCHVVAEIEDGRVTRQTVLGADITAPTLRSIPLSRLRKMWPAWSIPARHVPDAIAYCRAVISKPRPGRRGRGDLFWASIAALYVHFGSISPKPVAALAEQLGIPSARNLVVVARRKGFLTEAANRGRPCGQVTALARSVLAQHTKAAADA